MNMSFKNNTFHLEFVENVETRIVEEVKKIGSMKIILYMNGQSNFKGVVEFQNSLINALKGPPVFDC